MLSIRYDAAFTNKDNTKQNLLPIYYISSYKYLYAQHRIAYDLSDSGVRGGVEDAAQISGGSLDQDVAIHAPRLAPGVLDLPVGGTIGPGTVADSQDAVVQVLAALASQHTRRVGGERNLVSLDGNSDGLLSHSLGHGVQVTRLHVGPAGRGSVGHDSAASLAAGGLAGGRGVRVVGLGAQATVGLGPLKGGIHPATVAAGVLTLGVARHKLLLRQRGAVTSGNVVSTLQSTSSGERPARAALALVLHLRHSLGGHPVNGLRHRGTSGHVHLAVLTQRRLLDATKVHRLMELLQGQVGVLVQAHLVGRVASVVGLDQVHLVSEDLKSLDELSTILQGDTILSQVVSESTLVHLAGAQVRGGNTRGQSGDSSDLVHHNCKKYVNIKNKLNM